MFTVYLNVKHVNTDKVKAAAICPRGRIGAPRLSGAAGAARAPIAGRLRAHPDDVGLRGGHRLRRDGVGSALVQSEDGRGGALAQSGMIESVSTCVACAPASGSVTRSVDEVKALNALATGVPGEVRAQSGGQSETL